MPDCPYCGVQLSMCEKGAICRTCKRIYSPETVMTMPGYDKDEVQTQLELFILLIYSGALKKGANSVLINEDGVIIKHHGEQF